MRFIEVGLHIIHHHTQPGYEEGPYTQQPLQQLWYLKQNQEAHWVCISHPFHGLIINVWYRKVLEWIFIPHFLCPGKDINLHVLPQAWCDSHQEVLQLDIPNICIYIHTGNYTVASRYKNHTMTILMYVSCKSLKFNKFH